MAIAQTTTTVVEDEVTFTSDGQLLSELGERLIANEQVALAELIKNAYDADATKAYVWLDVKETKRDGKKHEEHTLYVQDDGHGMTEASFKQYWMTIATSGKLDREESPRYHRPVTGSKGVGRFAVRYLGRVLTLETTAYEPKHKEYRRLTATFNWERFKAGKGLDSVRIPYVVETGFTKADEGTRLTISELQEEWDEEKLGDLTEEVLEVITPPFNALVSTIQGEDDADPGFALYFCRPGETAVYEGAGKEIVERYVARVEIDVEDADVTYKYEYKDARKRTQKWKLPRENLIGKVRGEIRFFPDRPGLFKGLRTADGRRAARWVREHGGVRVIDRNFRMLPYGEPDDDWLRLSASKALNSREWLSTIARKLYPEDERNKEERSDPLLKIPANHQLLGAVYVSSYRPAGKDKPEDRLHRLQPAMDRQGFVENAGFLQLQDVVRGALELLAVIDVEEKQKAERREAEERTLEAQRAVNAAISRVQASKEMTPREKRRVVENLEQIGQRVVEMDKAHTKARKAVETMALLGVLAGFMTHEASVMLRSAERMLAKWRKVPASRLDDESKELIRVTEEALSQIRGHIDYSRGFIGDLRVGSDQVFKVGPQVNVVTNYLEGFTKPREIAVENKVPRDLLSPQIGLSVYSGILLNLFSNAVKAVLSLKEGTRKKIVRIDAWDEDAWHVLRVSDTGIGIPDEIRERIFDPLFSTTADDSPLGSGMGLGLHIVQRLVEELKGKIQLVEPPEGFSTCFEVRFRK